MVYNFFKKKEKQFLDKADHIISLTYNSKNVLEKEWQVIPNADIKQAKRK